MFRSCWLACPLAALLWSSQGFAGESLPDLASKAATVFKTHCHRCHGLGGRAERGVYMLNRDSLIARKKLFAGKAEKSPIYKRMIDKDDPMPPKDDAGKPNADPPTQKELEIIRDWIDAGAPSISPQTPRRFLTNTDLFKFILDDLDKASERDRRFLRYLTLVHLYNAGVSDDELDAYRLGINRLLNSLSHQAELFVPEPIDPAKTILRVDLRRVGWSEADWYRLAAADPFALVLDLGTAKTCCHITNCLIPALRGDVFCFTASRPPLYHDLLHIPRTFRELEKQLKVNSKKDISDGNVLRAGFYPSGVSINPRVVERLLGGSTPFWRSYDFDRPDGTQNIFANPLGPATAGSHEYAFTPKGGEIIFALENGLHAYMLIDVAGNRLDAAALTIVSDPAQKEKAVINGASCYRCHVAGFIPVHDQIRPHARRNRAAFAKDELEKIFALYPDQSHLDRQIAKDNARYLRALREIGVESTRTDPITLISQRFDEALNLRLAAAEAGVETEAFLLLIERNALLKRIIGDLRNEGSTIHRDVWVSIFPEVVREVERRVVSFRQQLPAQVGTTWAYRVTETGTHGRPTTYTVDHRIIGRDKAGTAEEILLVEKSVRLNAVISSSGDLMRLPKRLFGAGWVGEFREISVPAGKFFTLCVEEKRGDHTVTRWTVPGIGEVRRIEQRGDRTTTYELSALDYPAPPRR
ncbi:MAG TPA: hypothetical protein VMG10_24505 [Gemmataceae bacterium]|nr:hypothetical protein [Gemmataceae bacterium]